MNLILYPDNSLTSETNPIVILGDNFTYGIPAQRPFPYLDCNGVEIYTFGDVVIKSFFNCDRNGNTGTRGLKGQPKSEEIKEKIRKARNKQLADDRSKRRDMKKEMMSKALNEFLSKDGQ